MLVCSTYKWRIIEKERKKERKREETRAKKLASDFHSFKKRENRFFKFNFFVLVLSGFFLSLQNTICKQQCLLELSQQSIYTFKFSSLALPLILKNSFLIRCRRREKEGKKERCFDQISLAKEERKREKERKIEGKRKRKRERKSRL